MAINRVREKKQPKVMRFSNFVAKANGKDQTRRLALRSKSVQEAEDIEADDTSLAFCAIIDGDSPYEDCKAAMDQFYQLCLDSCEDGGRVFVTAVAAR